MKGSKLLSLTNEARQGFKRGFKKARIRAGYKTQQEFADAFSTTIDNVKNWEQTNRAIPEIDTIVRICDFLGCSLDYIFDRIDCKTHDAQFICDFTGLSEEAIFALSKDKENSILGYVVSYLIENGSLISALSKYYTSFVAEKLFEEPYCYLPLYGEVPDHRLTFAELSELLPKDRENFILKCDENFKHSAIFDYIVDYLDVFACARILDDEAFIVSALAEGKYGKRNINKLEDIPSSAEIEGLSDFEKAMVQSQMNLIPIQKSIIQECLDTAKVEINDQMASLVVGLRKIRNGGARNGAD